MQHLPEAGPVPELVLLRGVHPDVLYPAVREAWMMITRSLKRLWEYACVTGSTIYPGWDLSGEEVDWLERQGAWVTRDGDDRLVFWKWREYKEAVA